MSSASLLPSNSTPLDRALEGVISTHFDIPVPIGTLWNPDTCPKDALEHLAWAFSVDVWEADWPTETKRNVIRKSVAIHQKKGTVQAIKLALQSAGLGDATVVEGKGSFLLGGSIYLDGSEELGVPDHWAEYRVYLARPITNDQAILVRRNLKKVAPVRCILKGLYFLRAAHRLDGSFTLNGDFNLGVVLFSGGRPLNGNFSLTGTTTLGVTRWQD